MAGAGTRLLLLCTVAALLALGRADEGWDDTDEYDDVAATESREVAHLAGCMAMLTAPELMAY